MLTYLLHLSLCWALFALLYAALLRGETFFRANRSYLLGTLAAGLLLPLAGRFFPALPAAPGVLTLPVITAGLQEGALPVARWSVLTIFGWVYAAGVAITFARLLWGISQLTKRALYSRRERLPDGCTLVYDTNAALPFSFFRWVFVPHDAVLPDTDFQQMLAHERAHAQGLHSVDVLFLELVCVVFWFHPLAHWYRRALRVQHEYLADAQASGHSSRKQYSLLLLRRLRPDLSVAFVNHFFQAPLKKRLLMLGKNHSSGTRAWKYSLALPLAFGLALPQSETPTPLSGTAPAAEPVSPTQLPVFPGGQIALSKYLGSHLQYPAKARQEMAEGVVVLEFVVDPDGRVSDVRALSPKPGQNYTSRQDLVDEAVRVVQDMPRWVPGQQNGRAAPCKYTLPIRFKLE